MIKSKGIFAVSFIAMMVVGGAYANIASQGYVDQQIDTRAPAGDYATKTELNAKQNASTAVEVAKAGTAVGDATHPVYVNASGVATKIDKVAAAATADTATTADSATKATQDASGNVITTTYATKTELNAKADAEDIPTVNNATLTIQKNGAAVATFTANSETAATANITVPTKVSELTNDSGFITAAALPEEYTLPAATAAALGGVKSGGDITVAADGAVTVNSATTADSATKATQDASGRVIADTYATKAEIPDEITVDTALSADSTNPVQNKVVKAALDKKLENTATGTGSLSTGGAVVASGISSVLIGQDAGLTGAEGTSNVAIGYEAAGSANGAATAVGRNATAGGEGGVALGAFATSSGGGDGFGIAIGMSASGTNSVAIGAGAESNSPGSVALGDGASATSGSTTALGGGATASMASDVAVGFSSSATGGSSVAVGTNAEVSGTNAIQLGTGTNATDNTFQVRSYQMLDENGKIPAERMPDRVLKNIAGGHHSMAIGDTNITDDVLSATVVGEEATVSATGGAAYGAYATASASGATALGMSAEASGEGSVAVGQNAAASYAKGVAIGNAAQINGPLAIAVGNEAQSLGQAAVAIGPASKGLGSMGVAIGAAANATATGAIQLGRGENSEEGTFKVGSYTMLDSSGKIPGERLQISVGSATDPTSYADIWIE